MAFAFQRLSFHRIPVKKVPDPAKEKLIEAFRKH
jgi:hypothetical protein